jgi:AcrR family transcriptional regulator
MSEGRRYHVGDLPGRLLREARDMLEAGGLKQLNLRALAARAGITPASMYHHYENKTALLGELATGGFRELRRDLERAAAAEVQGRRLRAWATTYFGFARREPALLALMFDPEVAALPAVRGGREAMLAGLGVLVADVVASLGRQGAPEPQIAQAVWAAAHGAAVLGAAEPASSELIEDVILGLDALFPPGRA